eukprot:gene11351-13898_t
MPPKKRVALSDPNSSNGSSSSTVAASTSSPTISVPQPTTNISNTSTPSSPPTTASTTTTTTTTTTTAPSAATTTKRIQWYWAKDSSSGVQDTLEEYAASVNSMIEGQYQLYQLKKTVKNKICKLDSTYFINFKLMVQQRYDDPSKERFVERLEIIGQAKPVPSKKIALPSRKKPAAATTTTTTTTKSKKKRPISSSSDDSSDDSSESDSSDEDVSSSDSDSDEDEDYIATWSWAGDSGGGPAKGGGHQDIWVKYDKSLNRKLEKSFQRNKSKLKIDNERFADLQNMLQRRYDDVNKRRNIKREDPKKIKPIAKSKKKPVVLPSIANLTSTITPPSTITTPLTASPSVTSPLNTSGSALSLSGLIKCPSTWTDVDSMDYKEVEVGATEKEFKWMSQLFTDTIAPQHKGMSTLSPIVFNNLKVTRVVRVQNPMQWVRYHNRKQKILDDNKGSCPKIHLVATDIPGGPEVDVKANEFFMFHGLNISSITGITKFGFDPRFCSLEGMFGAGLYFAENSSKSNQYCHSGACTCSGFLATSCRCNAKDEVCLLVCRVVLGDALIEGIFRGNSKPGDFWHGRRTEPKKADGVSIHNSVIGESKANFGPKASLQLREYIVYESSQVYPEYKVYFKRVK